MNEQPRELWILITHGIDHELSSVAFTIANGGLTSGLKVSIFLTSAGVDLVRKGSTELTEVKPLEPLAAQIKDFMTRGGAIYACPPCAKTRGYEQNDLTEGVTIAGASVMLNSIKAGGATLSF
ncbi:MAG: DsrE family protein [Patescibacteria group bacterium]